MKFPSILIATLCVAAASAVIPLAAQSPTPAPAVSEETAIFAGGCFWCMQHAFDRAKGVTKTLVGYTGGAKNAPTYEEVSSGETGHAEAIEVTYDPARTNYQSLLDTFWKNIDPTAVDAQFADHGTQYRTAIFYRSDEQKKAAEASKDAIGKSGKFTKPIATQIVAAGKFFPAEEHHQEYYKKNPFHYNSYESLSGRAGYVKRTWGTDNGTP